MNVISYAQNFEDVMLWRALRDIPQGFYVDVGANDPVIDSVTRWFYQQGWHGINIEPVPHWFHRLQADRPLDINLQMAVSTTTGRLTLYDVPDTGLSTLSPEVAQVHQREGSAIAEITVPSAPLDSLLAQHAGDQDIHFLKIDVEGAERDVLQSMALARFRPWIILVEATEPRSPVTNHHLWEELLTTRGYEFAYFDGLNRFYVAAERASLAAALKTPPNTFDTFVRFGEWQARTTNLELQQRVDEIGQQRTQLQDQFEQQLREHGRLHQEHVRLHQEHGNLLNEHGKLHQEHLEQLEQIKRLQLIEQAHLQLQGAFEECRGALGSREQQLREMEESISWRITEPLRQARLKLGMRPRRSAVPVLPSPGEAVLPVTPSALPVLPRAAPLPPEPVADPHALPATTPAELLLHQISAQWRLVDHMDEQAGAAPEISCALCGHAAPGNTFTTIDAQCRFGGGRLRRYQCPSCDVIFGPFKMLRLSPEELGQEYDWHYRIFTEGDSTEQEVRAFKALTPQPGGTYLNYGAGAWSSSVQQLRAQGWNIVAYEPTGSAQAQPGLVTQREALAAMRFDGIYSNNVLEHLRHPAQDLRFLAGLLRPGARMSHATPCFEYLYEYTRFHLFFYLGRSRQLLAHQAGLRICAFEQDGLFMNTVYEPIELPAP